MDIQFLDRRADLLNERASDLDDLAAVAAALAEDESRQSRRVTSAGPAVRPSNWARIARREGQR